MDYSSREPRLDDENDEKKATEPNAFLEEALFKARTILLTGGIDFLQARRVCERLLALSSENDKPILLVLSSPGGHVESGDMIHDMIKFVPAPVKILGTGWCASAGALIYAAAKQRKTATPCRTPASCFMNRAAASEVRQRTWKSRPARSSRCASA
jgi:ATP-dependent Clp protease protease subunit